MPNEQVLMGIFVALLCAAGLWHEQWFLANTRKGQRLVGWFGLHRAALVLRLLLGIGVLFGILLAADVIRPVRW
jgi:hypothetical protein